MASKLVMIQIKDQFGAWHDRGEVSSIGGVTQALKAALSSSSSKPKQVRAVDKRGGGQIVDTLQS